MASPDQRSASHVFDLLDAISSRSKLTLARTCALFCSLCSVSTPSQHDAPHTIFTSPRPAPLLTVCSCCRCSNPASPYAQFSFVFATGKS